MTKKVWLIILVVVVVLAFYFVGMYNGLVGDNQNVDKAWADVQTQYQRRFDLIPNLVNSVKGAMAQEKAVFQAIADARTKYGSAATPEAKVGAANEVETALSRLLVVMENYPQLKSIDAVQTLMVQLEGTENRISVERGRFNEVVKVFDTKIKRFPTNIFSAMFGFKERAYFQSQPGAESVPGVNL
jgi:LemA protein